MSSIDVETIVNEIVEDIKHQMASRGYRAANELRNAAVDDVLKGSRGGRRYVVPGTGRRKRGKKGKPGRVTYTYYTASAPGEPPAVRTGTFRRNWNKEVKITGGGDGYAVNSAITSNTKTSNGKYTLGELLEEGTSRMAPRPYQEKIQEKSLDKIVKIYSEPYF